MTLHPLSRSIDTTATLDAELSPRKLDLIGVVGVMEILTKAGKVNRKTGEPLTIGRVSRLTFDHPTFPKPWFEESDRRFWRRADVEKWVSTYEQRDGPGPQKAKVLLATIDSQPDRIWTLAELMAEVRQDPAFAAGDLSEVVQRLAGRMAQKGRIRRVERGVYRSIHSNGSEE